MTENTWKLWTKLIITEKMVNYGLGLSWDITICMLKVGKWFVSLISHGRCKPFVGICNQMAYVTPTKFLCQSLFIDKNLTRYAGS